MSIAFRTLAAGCALGLAVAMTATSPAQAQQDGAGRYQAPGDQFYQEPAEPAHGLRFSDLEARVATDPLTWSSDPRWQLHRTPETQLTEATDVIRTAIPAGTSAADAAALLHRAGARCAAGQDTQVVCRYHDAETPYHGEYFDNVLWRVWLDTAGGRVTHVEVTRDWTRQ